MEHRLLGNSGTIVSRFGLGTMYFGGETSEEDAFAIMDANVEAGGNLIDTANVYMGGHSEAIVGRWFAKRPSDTTDRIVLATKGRNSVHQGPNASGLSRAGMHRMLNESLKNLGRDHIDLYQLHSWDPLTPVEETIRFLDDAVRAGKIHNIGLSNFLGWQLQLFVSTAQQKGAVVPISLQQQYSLLSRESEWECIPAALHNKLGLLPGRPSPEVSLPASTSVAACQRPIPAPARRARSTSGFLPNTRRPTATGRSSTPSSTSPSRLARHRVRCPWPGLPIALRSSHRSSGARTLAHLQNNLGASDLHLSAEAAARLEVVSRPQCGGYPYGAFGEGQRTRTLDGKSRLAAVVSKGSDAPLGR